MTIKDPAITGTSCWPLGGSLEISDRAVLSGLRCKGLQRAAKGAGEEVSSENR